MEFDNGQRLLRNTLEALPTPAMIIDAELAIAWHNPALQAILTLPPDTHADFLRQALPENVESLFRLMESLTQGKPLHTSQTITINHSRRHFDLSLTPIDDRWRLVLLFETTDYQEKLASALHSSRSDRLTRLANRRHFNEKITEASQQARRGRTDQALLMLDLDGFKPINDQHGHDAGDAVLVEIARRMMALMRETDFCARLGGDEFACIVTNCHSRSDLDRIAGKLIAAIRAPIPYEAIELYANTSIGIAMIDAQKSIAATLKEADRALYQAKENGKGCWSFALTHHVAEPPLPPPALGEI